MGSGLLRRFVCIQCQVEFKHVHARLAEQAPVAPGCVGVDQGQHPIGAPAVELVVCTDPDDEAAAVVERIRSFRSKERGLRIAAGVALAGGLVNVVLVLFLVELFDATGTLMGVAKRAGLKPQ